MKNNYIDIIGITAEQLDEIHMELVEKAENNYRENTGKSLGDVYSSLVAWDYIKKHSMFKDKKDDIFFSGIYDSWLKFYEPDDENKFRMWFLSSLQLARAKAVSCGML